MDIHAPHHDHQVPEELAAILRQVLNALLAFTGATAGWIGLLCPDGRLHFPVRAGSFSEAWLTLQQGQASIWGFEIRDSPTLVNQPPPLALLGDPPLRNLLSCLLRQGTEPSGQLVLANKVNGFTSQDAAALRAMALFLSRRLLHEREDARPRLLARLLYPVLDHVQEGILILDPTGLLVYANPAWANWTGYTAEELCNRPPPFPFWVSHTQLAALGDVAPLFPHQSSGAHTAPAAWVSRKAFPFRHRNHSLFWCQMETTTAEIAGQIATIVFLRRVAAQPRCGRATPSGRMAVPPAPADLSNPPRAQWLARNSLPLPFDGAGPRQTQGLALLLRPGGHIDLWDERWEELTGFARGEVAGICTELFLDWLFPRQADRSFVADLFHQPERRGAQAMLEITGRTGNHSFHFTFLPVRASDLGGAKPTARDCAPAPVCDSWLIVGCPCEATERNTSRGQA